MQLPAALAGWAPELAIFPPDLGLALGPLLVRTDILTGGAPVAATHGDGPPDGWAGITRRGGMEHLVQSQWALHQHMPQEFLRRLTMGELAYLERAHTTTMPRLGVRVVLDAGPDVLGAPRVACLAALLVLARRARMAGAPISWGILQRPDVVHPVVDPPSLQAWARARSPWPADASMVEAWLPQGGPPAEMWWVGGAPLTALAAALPGARTITVDELPGTAPPMVSVDVRAGAHHRRAQLQMPPERASIRLLRRPLEPDLPAVQRPHTLVGMPRHLAVSSSGRFVVWQTDRVGVRVAAARSPGGGRAPEVITLSPGEPDVDVVAVGWLGRAAAMVGVVGAQTLGGWLFSRKGVLAEQWRQMETVPPHAAAALVATPGLGRLLPAPTERGIDQRAWLHHGGLYRLLRNPRRLVLQAQEVLAVALSGGQLRYAEVLAHGEGVQVCVASGVLPAPGVPLALGAARRVFVRGKDRKQRDPFHLVAWTVDEENWHIRYHGTQTTLAAPVGSLVLGAVEDSATAPALICLAADRRWVLRHSAEATQKVVELPEPALEAELFGDGLRLAVLTEDWQVMVVMLDLQRVVWRLQGVGGP